MSLSSRKVALLVVVDIILELYKLSNGNEVTMLYIKPMAKKIPCLVRENLKILKRFIPILTSEWKKYSINAMYIILKDKKKKLRNRERETNIYNVSF